MEKDTELKELIERSDTGNKFSIYDYLKKTPSVFIASISALIAVVTFFARLMTEFSLRQELLFWNINPEHAIATDSIINNAVVSIIYAFLTIVLAMWFSATYESYAVFKSRDLTMRYFKKQQKKEIKRIESKNSKDIASVDEKEFVKNFNEICVMAKEVKRDGRNEFIANSFPIYIFVFLVTFLFAAVTTNGKNALLLTLVCFAIQMITLFLLSRFHTRKSINKKIIKNECSNTEFIVDQLSKTKSERFPISKISKKGIRTYMSNVNIIMVVIMLLINCITMCITAALSGGNPIEEDKRFQTVVLDDTLYAIVYQNGNQCFLEEAEITVQNNNAVSEKILTIYTNKQRIMTYDDIVIDVAEYDDIIRKQKADDSERSSQSE